MKLVTPSNGGVWDERFIEEIEAVTISTIRALRKPKQVQSETRSSRVNERKLLRNVLQTQAVIAKPRKIERRFCTFISRLWETSRIM